jgi:predicted metal-dependent HD superfamily phosphohydrolase
VPPERHARVYGHVMATRHQAMPASGDSAIVVDVDLSILGQAPGRYVEFEKQIRAEYRWVPGVIYRRKRREILKSFLDRGSIYTTTHFRERFETRARTNLAAAIVGLGR